MTGVPERAQEGAGACRPRRRRVCIPPGLQAPPDAILGISVAYRNDKDPRALNLGVGAYRTEVGRVPEWWGVHWLGSGRCRV